MPSHEYCLLYLTCKDEQEADKIANALLVKHLIACAKQQKVSSSFSWQGKIEQSDEVLLIMESRRDLFERIEKEVSRLHSYDIFVLEAVPVTDISKKAKGWLKGEINFDD